MGNNITTCFTAQPNTAKLVDLHRETVRVFSLPTTAAELMLEAPGRAVAPASDLRRDRRFSAMKADDVLAGGGVYLLIPIGRVNAKASEAEIAALESFCGERRAKRRSSKVQPMAAEVSDEIKPATAKLLDLDLGEESGRLSNRVKQWKPALEPICEGI